MKYYTSAIIVGFQQILRTPLITLITLTILSCQYAFAQLDGYTYKKLVKIDHTKVAGQEDHTNFPILISHTDPDLRTVSNGGNVRHANGYDIAFTLSDGVTQLDHEIEKYVAATGEFIAWVRITVLDFDDDTDIFIYYGNTSIATDPSTNQVWNSNYQGVWHLEESGDGSADEYKDASDNANDGQGGSGNTNKIPMQTTNGMFGNAQDFDGQNDYIDIGAINPSVVTVSAWAKSEGSGDNQKWQDIVGNQHWNKGGYLLFLDEETSGARFRTLYNGGNKATEIFSTVSTSDWHLYTGTFDGDTARIYVDGVEERVIASSMATSGRNVSIGDDAAKSNQGFFDGLIDEVRISSIAHSAGWIATEFNNQSDPASFYTVGVEMAIAPGGVSGNLALWLKANVGTSTMSEDAEVGEWNDQSFYANLATQAGTSDFATYQTAKHNYNPSLYFANGDNGWLDVNLDNINNTDYNVIGVIERDNSNDESYFIGTDGGSADDRSLHFGYRRDAVATLDHYGSWLDLDVSEYDSPFPSPALLRGEFSTSFGRTISELRDGYEMMRWDAHTTPITGNGQGRIGQGFRNTQGFEGYVSEVITYRSTLDYDEVSKVYTYLAVKYGLTMMIDYVATDGRTIWPLDDFYPNDIISIGRDDLEALYQRQSTTQDDSLIVYVDALAADNSSNAGSITNDISYLTIGHNGERLNNQTHEAPVGIYSRFSREWKVVNTNFDNNYSLKVEWEEVGAFDIREVRLLVDTDGDFEDAVVWGSPDLIIEEGSIIIGGISTDQIPTGSTRYITIGFESESLPLPIELTNFSAAVNGDNQVQLTWQTASEINNEFFTIERSKDGESWSSVMQVAGAGNSTYTLNYQEIDEKPYRGVSYYRLKQTDFDGQFTYSDIQVVNVNKFSTSTVKIYPNPGYDQVTLEGDLVELSEFRISDVLGNEVSGSVQIIDRMHSEMVLDISRLRTGVYSVKTKSTIQKLVKR